MITNNNADVRIVRRPDGWDVQRLLGSTYQPDDKVWITVVDSLTEAEARNIAGLPPRGRHTAKPEDLVASESICTSCGLRVVARANVHGWPVWTHRKAGR